MAFLAKMQRRLPVFSMLTLAVAIVLVAIFAAPEFIGLAEATGNPASSQGSTVIVYEWTIPTATKVTLSLIDPKATPKFTVKLYGCWVWGETLGEAPGFVQGDWSSSPFYMVVKDSQVVKVRTSNPGLWVSAYGTIDWDAGTITVESGTPFNAVAVKFTVKQPPIHSCNTLPNL